MKSMTGYGKARIEKNGRELTVEIKSVNHRYLDFNIKMPRIFNAYEDKLRKLINANISRGHLDVFVNFSDFSEQDKKVKADINLANQYTQVAKQLALEFDLINDFQVNSLIRMSDVVSVQVEDDGDELWKDLLIQASAQAIEELNKMRVYEGDKLHQDIILKIAIIEEYVKEIKNYAPMVAVEYRDKLKTRIAEALNDTEIDEVRIAQEVAFFTDKSNIDEELTRLFSHIEQLKDMVEKEGAIGRQLDFLVQEYNREVNTICSKSNNLNITNISLLLKNEIEKIREQVQNIE
ncbi:MAG: YicC/YloC family endoribonuclease [Clostridia bacterium]